jgi:hypothetical protein
VLACLKEDRDDQDRDDVHDLDHGIDRGAGDVLVRVADGIAGDGAALLLSAIAFEEAKRL